MMHHISKIFRPPCTTIQRALIVLMKLLIQIVTTISAQLKEAILIPGMYLRHRAKAFFEGYFKHAQWD